AQCWSAGQPSGLLVEGRGIMESFGVAFVAPAGTPVVPLAQPAQAGHSASGGHGTFATPVLSLALIGAVGAKRSSKRRQARASTAMRASVDEYIAEHEVIAFISPTCPYCKDAVASLTDAGYPPFIVEVDPALRSELAAKTNSTSVPKVWIKGNFIGGCNDGGMGGVKPLLRNGKIKELMS
ncbi:Glutaredoxin-1 (Glutathione-dependent oxidoreductase 1), partial [Durusdinium trenchii]